LKELIRYTRWWGVGGILLLAASALACSLSPVAVPTVTTVPPTPTPVVVVVTATPGPLERLPTLSPDQLIDIEEQLVVNVYDRVSAAVVHITSRAYVYSFFFEIVPQEGTGSGFVYDKAGHIITNYHVIEGAEELDVTLADGTMVPAQVIGADPYNDLAVIKIDMSPEKLHPVELGTSTDLRVGQRTIAIGNPFGLERTLTTGVISSLGRVIERDNNRPLAQVIQTDAAINPGNSGGPLLNSLGQVIGVNTAIRSPSGGSVGIGFAVPVDTVKRVVPELVANGRYPHPWVGIEGQVYRITPALAEALNLPVDKGLLIARIYQNSPAHRADLQGADRRVQLSRYVILAGGDIVTAIDGLPLESPDQLTIYLETKKRPGDEVMLTIWRDAKEMTVPLTLGERPEE
jgi:S1-C subfamily serine protease